MEFLKSGRQLNCAQSNFFHAILADDCNYMGFDVSGYHSFEYMRISQNSIWFRIMFVLPINSVV